MGKHNKPGWIPGKLKGYKGYKGECKPPMRPRHIAYILALTAIVSHMAIPRHAVGIEQPASATIRHKEPIQQDAGALYILTDADTQARAMRDEPRESPTIDAAYEPDETVAADNGIEYAQASDAVAESIYDIEPPLSAILITPGGYEVTEDEACLLARMCHTENDCNGYDGRLAVCQTAIDRLETGYGGCTTLRGVLTKPNQFSVGSGTCGDCRQAAYDAIGGARYLPDWYILHFRASESTEPWRGFEQIVFDSGHALYGIPRDMEGLK